MRTPLPEVIVLEGAEGVGKTTQLRLLAEWLSARGTEVLGFREPGGTVLGDQIRRILLGTESDITAHAEALLFMASRAQLVEREIRPALERGAVVLLDRFFLSTYAYQVAGRGLPEQDIQAANNVATDGLVPGLTLLFMLPLEEGMARADRRGERDRMEQADDAFHERVSGAFSTFASGAWQASHPECGPIVTIDARGSERDVHARVISALQRRWPGSFPDESSTGAATGEPS